MPGLALDLDPPPWASTICLTTYNPIPAPSVPAYQHPDRPRQQPGRRQPTASEADRCRLSRSVGSPQCQVMHHVSGFLGTRSVRPLVGNQLRPPGAGNPPEFQTAAGTMKKHVFLFEDKRPFVGQALCPSPNGGQIGHRRLDFHISFHTRSQPWVVLSRQSCSSTVSQSKGSFQQLPDGANSLTPGNPWWTMRVTD